MSGRVFISYSREDRSYVESLAAYLDELGVPIWYDRHVVPGDRWDEIVQTQIELCAAVFVVMTPSAKASRWVAREIILADSRKKVILPLLLEGEVLFRLNDLHYDSVIGYRMPTASLVERLRQLTGSPDHPLTGRLDVKAETTPLLSEATLGDLTIVGSGADGQVFQTLPSPLHPFPMAYKAYFPSSLQYADTATLTAMVKLHDSLADVSADNVLQRMAWPAALVAARGSVAGFLMQAIPDRFRIKVRHPSGDRKWVLASIQWLLSPPRFLQTWELAVTDRVRYELLRDIAVTLQVLHSKGIVVGDLAANNILFDLATGPRCFFLNCDSMVLHGSSVLPQRETTDWTVDGDEKRVSPEADRYKLGLLALRLFAGDGSTRDPHLLHSRAPELGDLVVRSLDPDALARPTTDAWVKKIDFLLDQR